MAVVKYQKWVAAFDSHGDMADLSALRAFKEFVKHWKPDIRIHGGDAFDLRCLRKGASKDEEFEDVTEDIDAGKDFLKWYRPHHFLRGNHDERLLDAVQSHNPILSRFASMAWTEIVGVLRGCRILPYDKRAGVLRLGHLKFIHGYHSGVNAARMAAQIWGACVMGHTHTIDAASIPGLEDRTGRIAGALCQLDMPYNRAQANTLRQRPGWAYGFLRPSGAYQYFQAECVDGVWLLPTEFREVKA